MVIVDTSGLLAVIDRGEPAHAAAMNALRAVGPPRLLSPFVLAELDYMVGKRVGQVARLELLRDVGRGVYHFESFEGPALAAARTLVERHAGLDVSLADASIVVLAEQRGTRDVLTLDERHFRVLTVAGKPFRILPTDA